MKKFILPVFIALSFTFWSCGNSSEKKEENHDMHHHGDSANAELHAAAVYICPCGGCPEVKESKPGKCPKCEMDLVEEKK